MKSNQNPLHAVSLEELLVSSLAQTDALAKLLIEKGIITQQEFMAKIAEKRASDLESIPGATGEICRPVFVAAYGGSLTVRLHEHQRQEPGYRVTIMKGAHKL